MMWETVKNLVYFLGSIVDTEVLYHAVLCVPLGLEALLDSSENVVKTDFLLFFFFKHKKQSVSSLAKLQKAGDQQRPPASSV